MNSYGSTYGHILVLRMVKPTKWSRILYKYDIIGVKALFLRCLALFNIGVVLVSGVRLKCHSLFKDIFLNSYHHRFAFLNKSFKI